jgi:NAD(P)-dependent dehydrogenase (short-subunit alcohol dehydrogenase family)
MSTSPNVSPPPPSNPDRQRTALIISVSSDIGSALAQRWLDAGWNVHGTYRTDSATLQNLKRSGLTANQCDLDSKESIASTISTMKRSAPEWDVLVLCPATLEPIGQFEQIDFSEWDRSINLNFTAQLAILHGVLETRRPSSDNESPSVLFFAGGGTNGSVERFSAYTVAKIALIKMVELLDTEIPDTRFSIIGPGWVDTKIHQETMRAANSAGDIYKRTVKTLSGNNLTPMDVVLDCCNWIVQGSKEIVSGRNFSVVYDRWGDKKLDDMLTKDKDMYKLRRSGNDNYVMTDRLAQSVTAILPTEQNQRPGEPA